jgi:hypothetical protein
MRLRIASQGESMSNCVWKGALKRTKIMSAQRRINEDDEHAKAQ